MTLTELAAQVTGLSATLTELKGTAATETEARKKLETQLAESNAKLVEASNQITKLKADAEGDGSKPGDADTSGDVSDAVKSIEAAIAALNAVLKDISGTVAGDKKTDGNGEEGEADAEDTADDMEAKAEATAKNFGRVLAVRRRQLARKTEKAKARIVESAKAAAASPDIAQKQAIATLARIGIPAPVAVAAEKKEGDLSHLKGADRVRAAFKVQLAALK